MKIAIIRFSSIGDIILTTPVIRNIKKQFPDAEIHYITKASFKTILESNPYIDKIHYLGASLGNLGTELKKENFDYVIDLHKNLRTLRLKLALNVEKTFSYNKLNVEKFLLIVMKINKLPNKHIVDRYLETCNTLNITNDLEGLDYFIPIKDEVNVKEYNLENEKFVVYSLGGQHYTKKLPIHKMIELCKTIQHPIALIGGPEDAENARIICNNLVNKKIINFCGLLNLNQSADVIKQSFFVVSHDTGMMHVAAAFKKKTFVIWGNTIPEFGMYPYLTEFKNIEHKNLSCRPCSKIGFDKCPKGHFKCMEELEFKDIILI